MSLSLGYAYPMTYITVPLVLVAALAAAAWPVIILGVLF